MIIVVGGIKGGTGKTTIATNLVVMCAATGKRALLVDGDEQESAITWANQREGMGIATHFSTVQLSGRLLRSQVERMKPEYRDIIIDVGGRDTTSLRSAISIADVCLIPFKPRSIDIWTWGKVKALISEMLPANPSLKTYAFINEADHVGSDNQQAAEILKDAEGIEFLSTTIGNRKAFGNAASDGLGVIELKPEDKKASAEMQGLYDFLFPRKTYAEYIGDIHSICPQCI